MTKNVMTFSTRIISLANDGHYTRMRLSIAATASCARRVRGDPPPGRIPMLVRQAARAHDRFDNDGDIAEADATLYERSGGDFVCGRGPPGPSRPARRPRRPGERTGKRSGSARSKSYRTASAPDWAPRASSGSGAAGSPAVRIGQGVADRQAHVGCGELRLHAAVGEDDEAVGDATADARRFESVSPAMPKRRLGLDHLESLVHHRGRVDRVLRSHAPRRMSERRGTLGSLHRLARRCARTDRLKRSARSPHDARGLRRPRHWKIALCSLSTGRSARTAPPRALDQQLARRDDRAPCWRPRRRCRARRRRTPLRTPPNRRSPPAGCPDSLSTATRRRPCGAVGGRRRDRDAESRAPARASSSTLRPAAKPTTSNALGMARDHVECLRSDRSGRPENRDRAYARLMGLAGSRPSAALQRTRRRRRDTSRSDRARRRALGSSLRRP